MACPGPRETGAPGASASENLRNPNPSEFVRRAQVTQQHPAFFCPLHHQQCSRTRSSGCRISGELTPCPRQANKRENEELLKSLGLAPIKKAVPPPKPKPKAVKKRKNDDDEFSPEPERELRRSGRDRRPARQRTEEESDDGDGDGEYRPKRPKKHTTLNPARRYVDDPQRNTQRLGERLHDPKTFGPIPGVEVGAWWPMRMDCSTAAIHAPVVAGISGTAATGAYSVALSGGYPDDVDLGEAFTYTGSGGRDLKGTKSNPKNLRTAPQTFDQSFDNPMNAALKVSLNEEGGWSERRVGRGEETGKLTVIEIGRNEKACSSYQRVQARFALCPS